MQRFVRMDLLTFVDHSTADAGWINQLLESGHTLPAMNRVFESC
jgi:hypothetical protein